MLEKGRSGTDMVASWQAEVAAFKTHRARYLLY
jgi:hypothetical protein